MICNIKSRKKKGMMIKQYKIDGEVYMVGKKIKNLVDNTKKITAPKLKKFNYNI